MRKRFEVQLALGKTPIERVVLPLKSRDELPPILAGLQWIFQTPEVNSRIFVLLESKLIAGKKATGRPVFGHALDINPSNTNAWFGKAKALQAEGRVGFEQAVECYSRGLEIAPHEMDMWAEKASVLNEMRQYAQAIDCCDKALAIDDGVARLWFSKGYALGQLGRHQEAVACYDRDIAIDPNDCGAWNNKSWELRQMRRFEAEITCYDEMQRISPDLFIWYHKGIAQENAGRVAEAIKSYREFVKVPCKLDYQQSMQLDARKRLAELEKR